MISDHPIITIVGGFSLMGLIVIAFVSVPAWMILAALVLITVVFGGSLDGYSAQHERRLQEEKLARVHPEYTISDIEVTPDPETAVLLSDLAIIGVDTAPLQGLSHDAIMACLSKEETIVLREMRNFLA